MRASLEGMTPVWPHVYRQVMTLGTLIAVCTENLNPEVVVMKSAQDGT